MSAKAARLSLRAVDLSLAAAAALTGACILLARQPRRRRLAPTEHPRLLAIDSMYSLSVLRARGAEHLVTHRDLDGYFDHVWSVHPLLGADPRAPSAAGVGSPTITALTDAHTMIEGKTRRINSLARLPHLNFALAQVQLVLMLDRIVYRQGIAVVRGDPYYHGLLAHLLGGLSGRPVELRIVVNYDATYETIGALAHPRLFRWRALEQRVARYTLSRADSVVVCSADNGEFALRNGARSECLTYLGNGSMVNPVHVGEPREREVLEDEFALGDRPVVVCVSRLERVKHPEDVVISVAKARRRDPRIAAVIVGDGAMRSELVQLCAELGVEGDIVFAGDRDQAWIARILAQSTVVAAPLAGLALVESALSGTPIVAYDIEWHSELIRSQQEGILVAYRDTDAMAAALCALIEDSEKAACLAAAARARVMEIMRPAKLLADERAHADELLAIASHPSSTASSPRRRDARTLYR